MKPGRIARILFFVFAILWTLYVIKPGLVKGSIMLGLYRYPKESMYKALEEMHDVMKTAGVPFILSEGTALGFYRNNDFIPHDDDVDLYIFEPAKVNNILCELKRRRHRVFNNQGDILQVHVRGVNVDIGIYVPDKHCVSHNDRCDKIQKYLQQIGTIRIRGKEYLIPKDEKYYEFLYGPDWRTPKRMTLNKQEEILQNGKRWKS